MSPAGPRSAAPGRTARPRWAALLLVTAAAALSIGWLARAPYDAPGAERALLRLSWRFRVEPAERCRPATPAELEALPVHMRMPEVCSSATVAYRLVLRVDDGRPDTIRVLPGGLRADRPAYVMLDTPLDPGPHRIRVRFSREDADSAAAVRALRLDTTLDMERGEVALVTTDPERRLVVRRPRRSSGRHP